MKETFPFQVEPLPYPYNGLEPAISKETLEFHHDKHYKTYVDNLNGILADFPKLQDMTLEYLLIHLEDLPADIQTGIRNNGGGVYNHQLYFRCMQGDGFSMPEGDLANAIHRDFESVDNFNRVITNAAVKQFGSGYAWLVCENGKLSVLSTANQETPISDSKHPLLCIDVWEHAYYLQYQNRRADYIANWLNLINWEYVDCLYRTAN
ncbi:MAG: superoxide dismutase [Lachnospiraceae bacterium]|nr:superoxide dismutase [Lachnospiraceae bacterium]